MEDLSGQLFDNYHLIKRLGRGNYGAVYLAEHVHHKTKVAIKILHSELEAENFASFLTEARAFQLEHPNIVRVRDFGVEDKRPFLVMSYTPNGNLRQLHGRGTKIPWETVVVYARQIADALQCVHDQGIVHRDIKPQNLLLGPNNEVMLGDFGIATISYTWNPRHVQLIQGSPLYMAPEQIDGKAVRESDQYALGIVMYEWLTGRTPFNGTLDEVVIYHHLNPPPPLRDSAPTLAPQAEALILKMLAKDPADRFASMREFAAALELIQIPQPPIRPAIFREHIEGVRAVAWSPDGRYVASAGRDTTVQVWEVTTGTVIYVYPRHVDEVWCLAWSPDSRYIASAGAGGYARVWEATTGYPGTTYAEHRGIIRAIAWSPDGLSIATAGEDADAHVWNAADATTIATFHRSGNAIGGLSWSPDSTCIALGGEDMVVYLWHILENNSADSYQAHTDRITTLAWSPDGAYIASGSDDGTVGVWDIAAQQKVYTYIGHKHAVASVAWSPKVKRLASGSWDGTAHVWGLNGTLPFVYDGHTSWVNSLSWSPDGQYVVSGSWDKTAHIWSPQ